jgi:thiol-disulfide isomerase/thioredoxin
MKKIILFFCFVFSFLFGVSQNIFPAEWRASLIRQDGKFVVFNIKAVKEKNETIFYILNGEEKIRISPVIIANDSVNFKMPVFESEFKTQIQADGSLKGTWFKGTADKTQQWPFIAVPGKKRFEPDQGNARNNISGIWEVTIKRANGTLRYATAEFVQKGNNLTGTFLTPSGDYRYLQGIVTGNKLLLSTFDGAHAYTFSATIKEATKIIDGFFGSGIVGIETWAAIKNKNTLPPESAAPQLKEGFTNLDFRFNDLDGNTISITDDRFKNKAVIIQIMGSWCPNCMDETKFLSDYYNKNKNRGIEVIALAYEYSTDLYRSQKSLKKFQQLFNVQYPMLITGATANDSLKTEKTLPQITPIKVFPSTIFINKKGNVYKIHSGFYGPGSGKYFEEYKKEFNATIDQMLKD